MNDHALINELEAAGEDLDRVLALLPSRLSYLAWMLTGGSGHGDEPRGRGGTEHWCDTHERTVGRCHAEDLDCRGVPLRAGGDPTGNAALDDSRHANLRRHIERDGRTVINAVERLVLHLRSLETRALREREAHRLAIENEPCCASCHRTTVSGSIRRREPVWKRLAVDGKLTPLCRWCGQQVVNTGKLPTEEQVKAHHRIEGRRSA